MGAAAGFAIGLFWGLWSSRFFLLFSSFWFSCHKRFSFFCEFAAYVVDRASSSGRTHSQHWTLFGIWHGSIVSALSSETISPVFASSFTILGCCSMRLNLVLFVLQFGQ